MMRDARERFRPDLVHAHFWMSGLASVAAAGSIPVLQLPSFSHIGAAYAMAGGTSALMVTLMFLFLNAGLGLRGPVGFHAAMVAANGDDARASAIVVIAMLGATSLGTALVAPFIERGLLAPAVGALVLAVLALWLTVRSVRRSGA